MPVNTKRLTVEDLETFPQDGNRYEIIDGELSMAAAPLKRHQRVLARLFMAFATAANASRQGEVFFAPVDVRFSQFDQVQPDLLFLRHERSEIYQGSTVQGPPDLVVEVISPSSVMFDEVAKLRLYESNGVPEYWIVNPLTRTIRRFTLVQGQYSEATSNPGKLVTTPLLPGLAIDPVEIFLGIDD
jgi:Uma2 family endonuclease